MFATAGRLDKYRPYQTIATDDIGKFVALAFDRPEDFIGSEFEIAGSELNNRQAAEVFARVLGRPVKFRGLPMPVVRPEAVARRVPPASRSQRRCGGI